MPRTLVSAALGYTVITLAAQAMWGTETWTRRGEGFARLLQLLLADQRVRDARRASSASGRRSAGSRASTRSPGTVAVVVVMIGTVTFDGLQPGPAVEQRRARRAGRVHVDRLRGRDGREAGRHARAAVRGGARRRLLPARHRGRAVGRRRHERPHAAPRVHPLAGADRGRLRDRPLPHCTSSTTARRSSTWSRTRSARAGTCSGPRRRASTTRSSARRRRLVPLRRRSWCSATSPALTLAHDRALALYGQAKLAVRSQYWMLGIMVGFTSLALWLLVQASK